MYLTPNGPFITFAVSQKTAGTAGGGARVAPGRGYVYKLRTYCPDANGDSDDRHPYPLPTVSPLHPVRIADALAQVLVRGVVGEPAELVLHGLGQRGVGDDRVLRLLVGEVGIEVCDVEYGFLRGQIR